MVKNQIALQGVFFTQAIGFYVDVPQYRLFVFLYL